MTTDESKLLLKHLMEREYERDGEGFDNKDERN